MQIFLHPFLLCVALWDNSVHPQHAQKSAVFSLHFVWFKCTEFSHFSSLNTQHAWISSSQLQNVKTNCVWWWDSKKKGFALNVAVTVWLMPVVARCIVFCTKVVQNRTIFPYFLYCILTAKTVMVIQLIYSMGIENMSAVRKVDIIRTLEWWKKFFYYVAGVMESTSLTSPFLCLSVCI